MEVGDWRFFGGWSQLPTSSLCSLVSHADKLRGGISPIRVLVLSDIHANLAALDAVLDDAKAFEFEAVWCLGDTVGYGPEPDECIARMRLLKPWTVVGNHDWAVMGRMDTKEFNREAHPCRALDARAAVRRERRLAPRSANQPLVSGDFTLTHGSPRDTIWEYILYPSVARANFDYFATPFCLVGHTHVPMIFPRRGLMIRPPT